MDSKVNMPWHTNQVVKGITHMSWWAFHQISGRIPTFHLQGQGVNKGIATKIKTNRLRNRMIKTILKKKYFQNTPCLGRGNTTLNVLHAHILRAIWVLIIEISCLKLTTHLRKLWIDIHGPILGAKVYAFRINGPYNHCQHLIALQGRPAAGSLRAIHVAKQTKLTSISWTNSCKEWQVWSFWFKLWNFSF